MTGGYPEWLDYCEDLIFDLNLRKALALLVYLALSDQPHSRDTLATMLWPESDGRAGRAVRPAESRAYSPPT